ncbi:hypothetical protein TREES_T100007835 [Tupaia chinensis]|uniref:Uncharacterized protein n=1 Tax=Tupaia chinensis TaxID=246437 RepID=L9K505_TUPCH|nr:hypothetical protein TREES_T100007835 [Tupaia chinensis]
MGTSTCRTVELGVNQSFLQLLGFALSSTSHGAVSWLEEGLLPGKQGSSQTAATEDCYRGQERSNSSRPGTLDHQD